jgi:hypothetical protein
VKQHLYHTVALCQVFPEFIPFCHQTHWLLLWDSPPWWSLSFPTPYGSRDGKQSIVLALAPQVDWGYTQYSVRDTEPQRRACEEKKFTFSSMRVQMALVLFWLTWMKADSLGGAGSSVGTIIGRGCLEMKQEMSWDLLNPGPIVWTLEQTLPKVSMYCLVEWLTTYPPV